MFRLDKACDLKAFTDNDQTRYACGSVRFRRPTTEDVKPIYRELRQPRFVRKYGAAGSIEQLNATDSYRLAMSRLRGMVEATNGKTLIRIPTLNGDEFPETPAAGREPTECLIPATHLSTAIKGIPRKPHNAVLESVRLTMTDDDRVILSTTDFERATDQTVRQVNGRWPKTDEVFPTGAPIVSIKLGAKLLEDIVKHVRQHSVDGNLTLSLFDTSQPARIDFTLSDGRIGQALIMPLT